MLKYFTHEGRRKIYFYLTYAIVEGSDFLFPKDKFGPLVNVLVVSQKEVGDIYCETKNIFYPEILCRYIQKPKLINQLGQRLKNDRKKILTKLKKIDIFSSSDKDLFRVYLEIYHSLAFTFRATSVIRRLDRAGMKFLFDFFERKNIKNIDTTIRLLGTTEKD